MAAAEDRWSFLLLSGLPGANLTGPVLASAGTIAPTRPIHHVSGVAAIANITLPYPGFSGLIVLIPDGIFTWTAAGNIAIAGTAVVNKALYMLYDASVGKWIPSYLA